MKLALPCLLLALTAAFAGGQISTGPTSGANPTSFAAIEGIVTKDPGGEPVKKALIEVIAENPAEGSDYTAVTKADGRFQIEGIKPGHYHVFVERTGLLEVDRHHVRAEGRVLALSAGQEVKDLQIRLQAAAVIQGRVVDEDGDALPGAAITVQRQRFAAGRSRWEQVGSERTNDLGEYRIANLPAGNYYVSVSPPPDFKSLIEAAGAAKPDTAIGPAKDKPATSYQTSYYPGTTDRSQATPIQLHPGDEFPINFSLTPSPSLSIRGSVVGVPPGSSATITLESRDFNLIFNGAEVQKDGSFTIRDVSPGAYTILAAVENSATPMIARQALQIAGSIEDLRLTPQTGAWIHGRLRIEANISMVRRDSASILLMLRSVDHDDVLTSLSFGEGMSMTRVSSDGSFEWKGVPPGNYYVQLAGDGEESGELYLKSVLAGGRDVEASGISVNGGSVAIDVLASANAGTVNGIAHDANGEAIANAVVVAVPEPRLRARDDRFRRTLTDQSGHFSLRGVPPGSYTLFAWESLDGDAYLNPDFLKGYEAQGVPLRIGEGDHKNLQLQVIPANDGEP